MQLIQPWNTSILKVNLADLVNLEQISQEILNLHCIAPQESKTAYKVTPEEFPALCDFRDRVVTNLVKEYLKKTMDYNLTDFTVDTFGKWFEAGTDLGAHVHGSTGVTSVFYPADYESGMTIYDPRGNASRGYPREIRDSYFSPYYHAPKAGDLLIFPGYLQHYVPTVKDALRLSLINDYMFKSV